jgi:hypothetical protein
MKGGGDGMFEWNNKIKQHVKYFIDAKTTTMSMSAGAWYIKLKDDETQIVANSDYGNLSKLFYIVYTRFKNFIPQHLGKAMEKSENIEEFLKTYYEKIKVDETNWDEVNKLRKNFNGAFDKLKNDTFNADTHPSFSWDIGINFNSVLKNKISPNGLQLVYEKGDLGKTQIMPTLEHLTLYLMGQQNIIIKLMGIKDFNEITEMKIRNLGKKTVKKTQSFAKDIISPQNIKDLLIPKNLSLSNPELTNKSGEWKGFGKLLETMNKPLNDEVFPSKFLLE